MRLGPDIMLPPFRTATPSWYDRRRTTISITTARQLMDRELSLEDFTRAGVRSVVGSVVEEETGG